MCHSSSRSDIGGSPPIHLPAKFQSNDFQATKMHLHCPRYLFYLACRTEHGSPSRLRVKTPSSKLQQHGENQVLCILILCCRLPGPSSDCTSLYFDVHRSLCRPCEKKQDRLFRQHVQPLLPQLPHPSLCEWRFDERDLYLRQEAGH